jgi:hypothetical protein
MMIPFSESQMECIHNRSVAISVAVAIERGMEISIGNRDGIFNGKIRQ